MTCFGHVAILRLLLGHGADHMIRDHLGQLPVDWAMQSKYDGTGTKECKGLLAMWTDLNTEAKCTEFKMVWQDFFDDRCGTSPGTVTAARTNPPSW